MTSGHATLARVALIVVMTKPGYAHQRAVRQLSRPPDIAIEVHSRNRAEDRGPKFEQVREAGIRAYWMLGPASWSLEAYRLQNGEYVLVRHGRDKAVFRPEELPGFELPLEILW